MDIIDRLIAREGGEKVVRDSRDPGGVTKFGISQKAYPQKDIANLTYNEARDIYIDDYFLKNNLQRLPGALQEPVLDWTVNSGSGVAIKSLQKLLGVEQDGVIGPKTADAAKVAPPHLLQAYLQERVLFYCRLVQRKPTMLVFLTGLISRAFTVCQTST